MQYRKYGKDGPEVSRLGFGAMRLPPRKRGEWGSVNFAQSTRVIRAALAAGVNLIDSHHDYHAGNSEVAIGKALKGWKGQRVYIQTKTPFYIVKPLKHYQARIETALEKLGVECIDYLFFHSMNMEMFTKRGKGFFKLTDWAMKKGYVRHRGFSTHDTPEHVKAFVDTGEFSAMLASYNWHDQTMADTLAYAARAGMGVSVMNPVGGGHLAADSPKVRGLIRGAKTAPEVALRFVLATRGVTLALSGMNTFEQVAENAAIASRKTTMTAKQMKAFRQRLAKLDKAAAAICTACGYCMPCPQGVDIPRNFVILSRAKLFGLTKYARFKFRQLQRSKSGDKSALACEACGACLPKCPNKIPIIEQLAETTKLLAKKKT